MKYYPMLISINKKLKCDVQQNPCVSHCCNYVPSLNITYVIHNDFWALYEMFLLFILSICAECQKPNEWWEPGHSCEGLVNDVNKKLKLFILQTKKWIKINSICETKSTISTHTLWYKLMNKQYILLSV